MDPRGASRPPLSRLHPTVNVLCFSAVLASVLVLDPIRWRQASLAAGLTAVWVVTSGLGWRRTVKLGALGFSLFAPVFLLAPWIAGGPPLFELPLVGEVGTQGLAVPARIAFRGMAGVLVGASLLASTSTLGFALGLSRIPLVPGILVVLTLQILRWTEVLVDETQGMARAIVLRGGRGPWRGHLLLVRSLPLVWLPRVAARAERVTAAMEVRGYGGELPDRPLPGPGWPDLVALSAAGLTGLGVAAAAWRSW